MFHPTPSYNHRQSCSIQYLGGKRKTSSSLGPLSWFNLLYGRLKSTQVSPNQQLLGGCYLIPFPCRASGSYSSPRSPCATVFDHLYIISPLGWGLTTENWFRLQKNGKALISSLFFHAFHDDEWWIETCYEYRGTKMIQNVPKSMQQVLAYGPSARSSAQSWRSSPIEWCRCPTNQFRPATGDVTDSQGERYEQPPNTP